ncbi:MAG: DUF2142 domain-containing protein [Actinomycetota bacterium]|nr:DUF2142 domain-containing protein [Actinomycetota bacterium]
MATQGKKVSVIPADSQVSDFSSEETNRLNSALIFAMFLLLAIGITMALTPPFQVPDTPVHFLKAASLAYGGLSPVIQGKQAGYPLPIDLSYFIQLFTKIPFHPSVRVNASEFQQAMHLSWSSRRVFSTFTQASFDPPILYIPDVIGVWIGRLFSLSILTSYYLAEAINALTAIAILSLAVFLSKPKARFFIYAVSFLPISLSLFGSVSRDSNLITLAVLALALQMRNVDAIKSGVRLSGFMRLLPTLLLIPVAVTKPPYVLLYLAFGLPDRTAAPKIWRIINRIFPFIVGVATNALWYLFAGSSLVTSINGVANVSPSKQIKFVVLNPFTFIHDAEITTRRLWEFYFHSAIGQLGWLDTYLPNWSFVLLGLVLAASILNFLVGVELNSTTYRSVIVTLGSVILSVLAVEAALYVTFTPYRAVVILGVQGRYFLPIFPLVMLLPQRAQTIKFLSRLRTKVPLIYDSTLYPIAIVYSIVNVTTLVVRFWLS